ncbi:hypothetical protein [Clostridium sp. MSTE9]|uniref:hypothetical protein n=1 Tax=Clostridium sp. (strain MSTE9) TaxID=1105031 RepID=UPI0005591412|nr:hypothetical protein [Clostridium sp. MSTE9]
MLKFDQVLSLTFDPDTGKTIATHYDIVTVRLSSETYDRSPNGYNLYEIDMNSVDCELDKEIYEITIAAGNAGDWVQIQKGLNPEASHETEPGIFECEMEDALIEGNLLIVTDIKKAVNV